MLGLVYAVCVSGPIFGDIQEIQPWFRITATTSQSHKQAVFGGGSRWRLGVWP